MDDELKEKDVVTTKKGKRKGKMGRVDQVSTVSDLVLVTWQNGYCSLSRKADLIKQPDAVFAFDESLKAQT